MRDFTIHFLDWLEGEQRPRKVSERPPRNVHNLNNLTAYDVHSLEIFFTELAEQKEAEKEAA